MPQQATARKAKPTRRGIVEVLEEAEGPYRLWVRTSTLDQWTYVNTYTRLANAIKNAGRREWKFVEIINDLQQVIWCRP